MIIVDDRTPEQKRRLTVLVVGTDPFLSGWGAAKDGVSYAAWACTPATYPAVLARIRGRGDMQRVRVVGNDWRPRGPGHTHIYVAAECKGDAA